MNKLGWNGVMLGLGALTMYYLDPDRGKRRRIAVSDGLKHCGYESRKFARKFRRDLEHRAEGTLAEAKAVFHFEKTDDEVLKERVRSSLGRNVGHPDAVDIKVSDGHVEVTGRVLAHEAEKIRHAVKCTRGVKDMTLCLETVEGPEMPSSARNGKAKEIVGLFGEQWSPTARVLVGGAGLALMLDGFRRHHSPASKAAIAGSLLLARSAFNMPLRRVAVGGIHLEKTIHVNAGREKVFAFWANPENYAKVFSHVNDVHPEGKDVYRWHVAGPAGVPITWTGKIMRQKPGKLVEWRSLPGSTIENHGVIRLDDEGDGCTRVHVQMEYAPPAGLLGHGVATLLGIDPRKLMHHDFVQLQSVLEHGSTTAHKHRVTAEELVIEEPVGKGA